MHSLAGTTPVDPERTSLGTRVPSPLPSADQVVLKIATASEILLKSAARSKPCANVRVAYMRDSLNAMGVGARHSAVCRCSAAWPRVAARRHNLKLLYGLNLLRSPMAFPQNYLSSRSVYQHN